MKTVIKDEPDRKWTTLVFCDITGRWRKKSTTIKLKLSSLWNVGINSEIHPPKNPKCNSYNTLRSGVCWDKRQTLIKPGICHFPRRWYASFYSTIACYLLNDTLFRAVYILSSVAAMTLRFSELLGSWVLRSNSKWGFLIGVNFPGCSMFLFLRRACEGNIKQQWTSCLKEVPDKRK